MGITLVLDTHIHGTPPRVQRVLPSHATEKILVDSLIAIRENRIETALHEIEKLTRTHPEFRLAQLVYGDLLLSKGQPITDVGDRSGAPRGQVSGLREEARRRLEHYLHRPDPNTLPGDLIAPGKDAPHLIVVDISRSRLYLYENDGDRIQLHSDYYASVGKNGFPKQSEGDQKTPIGIYMTAGTVPTGDLPDRYGPVAFPINYPNEWDKRFSRTGHGIWIHGVSSNTYSRSPHSSDGCIAIANEDLTSIREVLAVPGTPVIITGHIRWLDRQEATDRRGRFKRIFERWHHDWESRDHGRYAGHYSRDFRNRTENRRSWLAHKRRVNAKKKYIRVGVSNLRILGYPGERGTVEVTFEQDYRSDNYSRRSKKRQYWRKETDGGRNAAGRWRIVYEATL